MSDPGYRFVESFLEAEVGYRLFSILDVMKELYRRPNVPRKECWMNDFERPYTYGGGKTFPGRTYEATPWTDEMRLMRDYLRMRTGVFYEGCFINQYEDGRDSLDWHADDDPGINHNWPIAVITLGQDRPIHVRSNDRTWHGKFLLTHGSLLEMPAGSQFTHQHKIPKGDRPDLKPRISLTFRSLVSKEN